ncbi:hypothetical protein [Paucibacter soli]|uniref:hypothetical protein n=1 Tax=Paucibacter soli TaxID=3133433 RepID=UPI0030A13B01
MNWRQQLQSAWTQQSARIDALSVRERLFIFLTLAVLLLGLLDRLLVTPLSQEQSLQLSGQRKVETELQALRQQFLLAGQQQGPNSPQARLRAELDEQGARQLALQQAMQGAGAGAASAGATLPSVLDRLLQSHAHLRLLRLQTLDELPPGLPAPPPAWRLQAVELRVQGNYLDLTKYLSELQSELPGLRWGELRLAAQGEGAAAKAVLQLQLVLASPQP